MIKHDSTWVDTKKTKSYTKLNKDTSADVVIVGAGLVGILSAYLLSKAGKKVIILEQQKRILNGVTAYTTAHITQIIDTELSTLLKIFGQKKTKLIWNSGADAIKNFEQIVKKEKIECSFTRCDSYVYANHKDNFDDLESEYKIAKKLGFKTRLDGKSLKGFRNHGTWIVPNQAKFHPLMFAQALADKAVKLGARIHTDTEVTDFKNSKDKITVKAGRFTIEAKDIIISTYKPLKLLNTFAKKGKYKTYVMEAEIRKNLIKEGLYEDTASPYHYFRIDNIGNKSRIIIGGEDHRAMLKVSPKKNFAALEQYLKDILDGEKYKITKQWAGPILEPSDGLALIGQGKPHQYVATGFSGTGMIYSMIAAMIFRDLILKKKNPYTAVYNPTRIPTPKQLAYKARDYGEEWIGGALKNTLS